MIDRPKYRTAVELALQRSAISSILGPRQCGKTTLAHVVAAGREHHWFDLEDPAVVGRLAEPGLVLRPLSGLVVIDEIQRMPELFPLLRVLADRDPLPARFLILGSASLELIRQSSESLAGRIEFVDLGGFTLDEVTPHAAPDDPRERLWLRGGLPRSFLAASDTDAAAWRESFIRTFLERDLPQLGVRIPAATMRRFWTMLAHYHGQNWNGGELGRALGLTGKTVRSYLDALTSAFVVRQIQPWFENLKKRQVKAPRVFVRDTGLLHSLLGIDSPTALSGHPKAGASWEGFAIEQVLHHVPGDPYFWSTHTGAEIDLVLMRRPTRWGFEMKLSEAPTVTRSMRVALEDLRLDHLWVVYPGSSRYPLADRITALPVREISTLGRT